MFYKKYKNILKPQKIPSKIIKKMKFYYKKKKYDKSKFEQKQNEIFKNLKLDRNLGLEKLNNIKKQFNFLNDRPMSSEHEVLFSSISLINNFKIHKILEIGTFDGANSFLLSKLFPESKIHTIDLGSNDDDFINFYNRKESIKKFIDLRNQNLSKNNLINFTEMNSLNLINSKEKYDLIWIDGAHGYPVVCIDIINSLNLISNNGFILCDDIYTELKYSDSDRMYNSTASYETLNALNKQNLISLELIFKRLGSEHNCVEEERQFVAIFKKIQ